MIKEINKINPHKTILIVFILVFLLSCCVSARENVGQIAPEPVPMPGDIFGEPKGATHIEIQREPAYDDQAPGAYTAPSYTAEDKYQFMISPEAVARQMPSYMYNLKRFIAEAEKNIKKADEKIQQSGGIDTGRASRELMAMGVVFYDQGKLQEAIDTWDEVLSVTKDPYVRKHVQELKKKAQDELNRAEDYNKRKRQFIQKQSGLEEDSEEFPEFESMAVNYINEMGVVFYENGNYEDALSEFEKVLSLDPGNEVAKRYIGLISLKERSSSLQQEALSQSASGDTQSTPRKRSFMDFLKSLF